MEEELQVRVKDASVTMVNQTHGHLPLRPRELEGKFDIQFPLFTRLICAVECMCPCGIITLSLYDWSISFPVIVLADILCTMTLVSCCNM